ncbi:MAG: putative nucleic acid-binding protein, contains Zn-ribbon domain [Chloroflexi bacterium]|nr:MAG: putative nucleic acid-binding protein, contains Zn-ribbon domain [Chloroflexota bacterium]
MEEVDNVPIYEYRCRACNHRFELKQGFDAEPMATCPVCSSEAPRMFSMPAVIYKGTGFYTTDYKQKESGYRDGDSSKKSSKGEKTEETKTESTKSESKEDSKSESKVASTPSKTSSKEE